MGLRTFIICQFSVGIGHLTRASALAKALSSISHVTLFSGGRPAEGYVAPSGVDFIQLPAFRRRKAGEMPVPVDEHYTLAECEGRRSDLLIEAYHRIKPHVVITEYFPFAPRRFGKSTLNELFNVMSKEKKKPVVICSARTVLREEAPDLDEDPASINAYLKKHFSCVLHHADANLFPLSTLGSELQIALSGVRVWQTGFVRRPFAPRNASPSNGLLLTVGGGSTSSAELLIKWINAAKKGSADLFPIVAVCGPLMDAADRKRVQAERAPNITVHDWVSNMDDLISSSRAVVCLGGYNTPIEALSQKKPVLAFPDRQLGDQVFQINVLHARGLLLQGHPRQSEGEITALMNDLLCFHPEYHIDCNGAERSVKIVKGLLNAP